MTADRSTEDAPRRWHEWGAYLCECTDGRHGGFLGPSAEDLNALEAELTALRAELDEERREHQNEREAHLRTAESQEYWSGKAISLRAEKEQAEAELADLRQRAPPRCTWTTPEGELSA